MTIANATEKEFDDDGELLPEAAVREGKTTGQNARPTTKRDLVAEKKKKRANMAKHMAKNMIKFKEVNKEGDKKATKMTEVTPARERIVSTFTTRRWPTCISST
jgi:hypothetical protein